MKAFLMYRDRDFELPQSLESEERLHNLQAKAAVDNPVPDLDSRQKLAANEPTLIQDLELNTLFNAMALENKFLFEVARKALSAGLHNDLDTILYRQRVLEDCLKNSAVVREMYAIAVEAIESERKSYFSIFNHYTSSVLHSAIEVMELFMGALRQLRQIAEEQAHRFHSEGFSRFFEMLQKELGDPYFAAVRRHLRELKFRGGVLISAELGKGNKGTNYVLRKPMETKEGWIERMFAHKPPVYTFQLHPRDENGARALADLKTKGIHLVSNALARSVEHILSFLEMMRVELAFYIGCLNLQDELARIGAPVCFPEPAPSCARSHAFAGLYDVCLALSLKRNIVGNDVNAEQKSLVIITGANQGGKSTFLRSVGLAQLLMQCGMFAPAECFRANLCDRLFTHYKREEDVGMQSGKFDEELTRMSEIVDHLTPNSMLLFNESFAATNDREGSEIARQIVCALLDKRLKIFYVTHLYDFARGFYDKGMDQAIFLRAERQLDGIRTFKLIEGEPLDTSYGEDLYNGIFGPDKRACVH